MNTTGNRSVWALSGIIALLLSPLLFEHFEVLLSRRHYQWAPLLVGFIVVLFTLRWQKSERSEIAAPTWVKYLLILLSILLMVVAYLYYTGWVAMAAAILALGVLSIHLRGLRKVEGLFGLWMLLFLFVRLPHQIESRLLVYFQNLSAKFASILIDYSGSYHVVQGGFMTIDDYEIALSNICSGYFSLVSVLVLTALYAFFKKRPTFHTALLLPGAFIAAVTLNTLRVAFVGIHYAKVGVDIMDTGWLSVMAVVSFVLSLLLLISYDALLSFFFMEVDDSSATKATESVIQKWNKFVSFQTSELLARFGKPIEDGGGRQQKGLWTSVLVLLLIGLTAFEGVVMYYKWGFGDYQTYFMHDKETLVSVDEKKITFNRPGWEVLSVEDEEREMSSIWGAYSTVWRLRYHETVVVVALDYPFDKWHDVKRCYTKLGWQVKTENLWEDEEFLNWGASETEFTLPEGSYGMTLCSHSDHIGTPVKPKPTDHRFSMVMYYLHPKQWTAPFGVSVDKNKNTFYQTQMMVTSAFDIDEPIKEELRKMYGEFREQTRELIEQHAK